MSCFHTYKPVISMLLMTFHSLLAAGPASFFIIYLAPSGCCLLREACHRGRDMVPFGKRAL